MTDQELIRSIWPQWEAIEAAGRGSFGSVYKARRADLSRDYYSAIKIIHITPTQDEYFTRKAELGSDENVLDYYHNYVSSCTKEIEMMMELRGVQNIVYVEDYAIKKEDSGFGWHILIRMEYLTCLTRLLAEKSFSEAEIISLGIDLCNALCNCEKNKLLHRDIKPSNIFINSQGVYKLGDFGIARHMSTANSGMSQKGTYDYIAPEILRGHTYDHRVDIYGLGLVLYRLSNKNLLPFVDPSDMSHPFSKEAALAKRFSGKEAMPAPMQASAGLSAIILKACAFAPEDRYDSAEDMKTALLQLQKGQTNDQDVHEAWYFSERENVKDDDATYLFGEEHGDAQNVSDIDWNLNGTDQPSGKHTNRAHGNFSDQASGKGNGPTQKTYQRYQSYSANNATDHSGSTESRSATKAAAKSNAGKSSGVKSPAKAKESSTLGMLFKIILVLAVFFLGRHIYQTKISQVRLVKRDDNAIAWEKVYADLTSEDAMESPIDYENDSLYEIRDALQEKGWNIEDGSNDHLFTATYPIPASYDTDTENASLEIFVQVDDSETYVSFEDKGFVADHPYFYMTTDTNGISSRPGDLLEIWQTAASELVCDCMYDEIVRFTDASDDMLAFADTTEDDDLLAYRWKNGKERSSISYEPLDMAASDTEYVSLSFDTHLSNTSFFFGDNRPSPQLTLTQYSYASGDKRIFEVNIRYIH